MFEKKSKGDIFSKKKKEQLFEIFHKQKKIMDLKNQKVQNIFSKEKKEIELKSFLNRRKSLN